MLKKFLLFAVGASLIFSSVVWAQEIPPTVPPPPPDPRKINVPLGEFVLDSVEGNASWPSVINPNAHISANNIQILDNSVDIMLDWYVESRPYLNVLVHGSYLTVSMDVILTDNYGFPYYGLVCSNFNGTEDLIYFTGGQLTLTNKFSSIGISQIGCGLQTALKVNIKITKITYIPVDGTDLTIGLINIPEAKLDPSDGFPIIPIGIRTLINVPVSINYNASTPLTAEELSTFVPVTLQAGSQTYTQSISIANLVANGNNMTVPFMVTFQPIDVGLKTLIATVNPSQIFKESNFANNEAQQKAHVVDNKYKIVKEVTINGVLKNSDFVSIAPTKEDGCSSTKKSIANIKIRCVKEVPGSIVDEVVDGCQIKRAKLSLSNFLGGHESEPDENYAGHNQATRPLGSLAPTAAIIPKTGLDIKYTAPEVSGGYIAEFEAKDPDGNSIDVNDTVFTVETQTPFVSFTTIPGLRFHELNSHPGDMFWGTTPMYSRITAAVKKYFISANRIPKIRGSYDPDLSPFDNPNISEIYSQGVSLRAGGLFDVARLFIYTGAGHCGHRKGIEIDISLSTFNNEFRNKLKEILAKSIGDSDLEMKVPNERPEDLDSDHWHAKLTN